MISVKFAIIMAVGAFAAGSFSASPLPQAIAAVIASDVQCTGCVGTTDVAGNAITAAKIKDGEVKAADIAANAVGSSEIATNAVGADEIAFDAVGANEIKGVDKLIFADCIAPANLGNFPPHTEISSACKVAGVDSEDDVIAMDKKPDCFPIISAYVSSNSIDTVIVWFMNTCDNSSNFLATPVSLIIFDELPDKVPPG